MPKFVNFTKYVSGKPMAVNVTTIHSVEGYVSQQDEYQEEGAKIWTPIGGIFVREVPSQVLKMIAQACRES